MAKKKRAKDEGTPWHAQRFTDLVFVFTGSFPSYDGTRDELAELIAGDGGSVAKSVTLETDYLVVGGSSGKVSAAEKKAAQLNQNKSAGIQIIDLSDLHAMLLPDRDLALAMLFAGKRGQERFTELCRFAYRSNSKIDLSGVDFRGQDLSQLNLQYVDFDGCDFRKANLQGSQFGRISNARFDDADMSNASITDLTECSLKKTNLHHTHLNPIKLKQCDLTGANLSDSFSSYTICTDVILKRANLSQGYFDNSQFLSADFTGADLSAGRFAECDFSGANLARANLAGAELTAAKLVGANLTNANLSKANLAKADLTDATISGAKFAAANIGGAKFDNVDTAKAKQLKLEQATAVGKKGPNILELEKVGKQAKKLQTSITIQAPDGKVEIGVTQYGSGYVYTSEQRGNSGFHGYNNSLSQAMLDLCVKNGGGELLIDSLQAKGSKSPVMGKDLKQLALAAWSEAYGVEVLAEEEVAKKQKATRESKAKQREEHLELLKKGKVSAWNKLTEEQRAEPGHYRRVELAGAKLQGVSFSKLDFQSADFSTANLQRADFDYGDFRKANFAKADLSGVRCGIAKLQQADFSGAKLKKAHLRVSKFRRANFTDADLQGADFGYADLCGANLTNANLKNVNWEKTEYDDATKMPAGFTHQEDMIWRGAGHPPGVMEALKAERPTGPIDMETFLERLKQRVDASRFSKALKMLKADRFELFADVDEEQLVGVVKSQTDASLVYSCRLAADGSFACCTQNLNACGGLRGKLCKHLLVLIIGLVQGDRVDATTADEWADASRLNSPELDKDIMSETLLRYKGAEAGEVDWRPTETVPEDYYAF